MRGGLVTAQRFNYPQRHKRCSPGSMACLAYYLPGIQHGGDPWLRPLRALPRNCASAPPAGTNGPTRHMEDIVMTSHLLYPLILRASPARSGEAHGQSPGAVSGEEIRPPQRERSRAQHCRTRQFSGRHIRAGLHRSHSNLRAWRRVCSPKRPVPKKISTIRLGRKRGELLRARS